MHLATEDAFLLCLHASDLCYRYLSSREAEPVMFHEPCEMTLAWVE